MNRSERVTSALRLKPMTICELAIRLSMSPATVTKCLFVTRARVVEMRATKGRPVAVYGPGVRSK